MKATDFRFNSTGYGHFRVVYTSPRTGKKWSTITANMPLVDAVKNSENPTQKDMNLLKKLCKSGGRI